MFAPCAFQADCSPITTLHGLNLSHTKLQKTVFADEAPGPLAEAPAEAKLAATTAYLVLPPPRGALRRCLGLGPGARAPAWLPLWRWERDGGRRAHVFDYGGEAAAGSGGGGGGGAPAHVVRTVACDGDDARAALRAVCAQLAAQARRLAAHRDGGGGGGSANTAAAAEAAAPAAPVALASATYRAGGAARALRVSRPAAPAAAAFSMDAASLELRLEFEPPPAAAAGVAASPAGSGTLTLEFDPAKTAPRAAAGRPPVTPFQAAQSPLAQLTGTHGVALLRSARSALVATGGALPAWVMEQLRAADAASDGSARVLPPVAAWLRPPSGEQWLLCCDALATASIGANLGVSWPRQPQGLRCWYSRHGRPFAELPHAAAAAAAAADGADKQQPSRAGAAAGGRGGGASATGQGPKQQEPGAAAGSAPGGGGGGAAASAGGGGRGRAAMRSMAFSNAPDVPTQLVAALSAAEAGGAPTEPGVAGGSGSGGSGGSGGNGSGGGGGITAEALAGAAAQWTPQSSPPDWAVALLAAAAVQWAPAAASAPWATPPGLRMRRCGRARGGGAEAHAAELPDSGLSRAFLFYVWNQGSEGMQKLLAPSPPPPPPPPKPVPAGTATAAPAAAAPATAPSGGRGLSASARRWLAGRSGGGGKSGGGYAPPIDGLLVTAVEEALLRREPLLAGYWRRFDALDAAGCRAAVTGARAPLLQFAIGASVLSNSPGQHSHMTHSLDTLAEANCVPGNSYSYYNPLAGLDGGGGGGHEDGTAAVGAGSLSGAAGGAAAAPLAPLLAVAMDSGTWPMDGGGVATCREQVLQGTADVRWRAEAEVAHDLKVVLPKMRAQPNVTRVALTIQWDTQHDSPNQSTFCGVPYARLTRRAYVTTRRAVRARFLPAWRGVLIALRKANVSGDGADAAAAGEAFVALWRYFQLHDWDATWADPQVCVWGEKGGGNRGGSLICAFVFASCSVVLTTTNPSSKQQSTGRGGLRVRDARRRRLDAADKRRRGETPAGAAAARARGARRAARPAAPLPQGARGDAAGRRGGHPGVAPRRAGGWFGCCRRLCCWWWCCC